MSPKTTPMAPRTSGARAPAPGASRAAVAVAARRARVSRRAVLAAAREADVELLQLAVEVRALEPGLVGDAAHVALLAAEQLLEVDPLERLARLAQRQLEEARGDLRRDDAAFGGAASPSRRLTWSGVMSPARRQREVDDDAVQVVEVAGPVRVGERGERGRLQRRQRARRSPGWRSRAAPRCRARTARSAAGCPRAARAAAAASPRRRTAPTAAPASNLPFGREVAQRLGAGAHERDVGALELGQQEREPLLLGLRVLADLGAVERRRRAPPRAAPADCRRAARRSASVTQGASGSSQRARRDVVTGARLAEDRIGRRAASSCSSARSASRTGAARPERGQRDAARLACRRDLERARDRAPAASAGRSASRGSRRRRSWSPRPPSRSCRGRTSSPPASSAGPRPPTRAAASRRRCPASRCRAAPARAAAARGTRAPRWRSRRG